MAFSASSFAMLLSILFLSVFFVAKQSSAQFPAMDLTVVNNCPFPLWPAIQPNSGSDVLEGGGFFLPSLSHHTFPAPTRPWSGRIWARTSCVGGAGGSLSCATGDCGGRFACGGLGGAGPTSLAQITLHHGGGRDLTSYGVSLVDGFNVGMTVTPHEGKGRCPVVGCRVDLLATCPSVLQVRAPSGGGRVMGCKSGCAAFNTDELCCRNKFNSPDACRPNSFSEFFKRACPTTFTYAHDSPSLTHECASPRELKVIFCH